MNAILELLFYIMKFIILIVVVLTPELIIAMNQIQENYHMLYFMVAGTCLQMNE